MLGWMLETSGVMLDFTATSCQNISICTPMEKTIPNILYYSD